MNLVKRALQKGGMVLTVIALWVLDDFAIVLPDKAVWVITEGMLHICGHGDRLAGLQAFWIGKSK